MAGFGNIIEVSSPAQTFVLVDRKSPVIDIFSNPEP